jgi:hypothetical protein
VQVRSDIIFTTICISNPDLDYERGHFRGEYYYAYATNALIDSVLTHTSLSIVVVTDVPEKIKTSDRVLVHDIRTLTNEPRLINRYMNFHLKRYALKQAFQMNFKYVFYLDCDILLKTFNVDLFNYLDTVDVDVCGKLGTSTIRYFDGTEILKEKIKQFGPYWNDEFLNATLPFEMFFIFKQNQKKQALFMDIWDRVAIESTKYDILTLCDSYYFGVAMYYAKMNKLNLQEVCEEYLLRVTNKFFDNFRILQDWNVCTIQIDKIKSFSYDELKQGVVNAV